MISIYENSSTKSFKQTSTCNSPQPAMMFSPVSSSLVHNTNGSDLANLYMPAINLGKSPLFFGLTATLTTGETLYFMTLMLQAHS